MSYEKKISIASIWIDGGSNIDKKNKKGINQILSSLLIRGCEKYDNYTLSEYLESFAADLNCETHEDGILINLISLEEYFNNIFPLLTKIIEKPILSKEEFNNSKINAINNIIKSKENPFNIAYENWRKIVYLEHPYAFDVNGYIENINNINYLDILDEYSNFKTRSKFLLSNYYKNNMKDIDLITNKILQKEVIDYPLIMNRKKRNLIINYQETNQLKLLLGNKTCSKKNNDFLPLKILESYLSFGMSSKLFKLFREKYGLTYDVGVYFPNRKLESPFLIYLSVSEKNSLIAFKILLKLWKSILTNLLSDDELNLAKIKLNASILNSSQTVEEIINRKVQLLGFGMNPNFEKNSIENIENISSKRILKTTKKYLEKPILSICGKEKSVNILKENWDINF